MIPSTASQASPKLRSTASSSNDEIARSTELARAQADRMVREIIEQGGTVPPDVDLAETKMIAIVAYLQRLGTDLTAAPEETSP